MNRATIEGSLEAAVVEFVAEHPGLTVEQIAQGVHKRKVAVADVLASEAFSASVTVGPRGADVRVYSLATSAVDGTGRRDRPPTHDEKVLALLSSGEPVSHLSIYALHVVGHSRIASLRSKGYTIVSRREGDLYWYRLIGEPQAEAAA